ALHRHGTRCAQHALQRYDLTAVELVDAVESAFGPGAGELQPVTQAIEAQHVEDSAGDGGLDAGSQSTAIGRDLEAARGGQRLAVTNVVDPDERSDDAAPPDLDWRKAQHAGATHARNFRLQREARVGGPWPRPDDGALDAAHGFHGYRLVRRDR